MILFEEFLEIKNNQNFTYEIIITINSKQEKYTCPAKSIIIINNENIKTKDEEKKMVILLLKKNLEQPPIFQYNNLELNNIHWN